MVYISQSENIKVAVVEKQFLKSMLNKRCAGSILNRDWFGKVLLFADDDFLPAKAQEEQRPSSDDLKSQTFPRRVV
jgi:hypothetical protein